MDVILADHRVAVEQRLVGRHRAATTHEQDAHDADLGLGDLGPRLLRARHDDRPAARRDVERIERADDVAHRGPSVRLLRQHGEQERFDRWRKIRDDAPWRSGILEEDPREHGEHVVAFEGADAGEALVEHAAEREGVGAGADVAVTASLLRSHVARRSHRDAGLGRAGGGEHARHAEIEQFRRARIAADEEHVRWLHVAVDDTGIVGGGERGSQRPAERDRVVERDGLLAHAPLELLALEPLHREVRLPVGRRAVPHEPNDGRMIERLENADLLLEALEGDRIERRLTRDLDRDFLSRARVAGAVHDGHSTAGGDGLHRESAFEDGPGLHDLLGYTARPRER